VDPGVAVEVRDRVGPAAQGLDPADREVRDQGAAAVDPGVAVEDRGRDRVGPAAQGLDPADREVREGLWGLFPPMRSA
jgi:hypothetical protein